MPPEELIISTPAQVRALASGVRTAVVESLLVLGPSPLRDVARRLNRSPESLYHHARILERAGIIRVAGTRPVGRTTERLYALVATRIRLDRTNPSRALRNARAAASAAMLAAATRRAKAAIARGLDEGTTTTRQARVETVVIPLDAAALAELHARVEALWSFLRECRGPNAPETGAAPPIAVTIAITPAHVAPSPKAGRAKPRSPRDASR